MSGKGLLGMVGLGILLGAGAVACSADEAPSDQAPAPAPSAGENAAPPAPSAATPAPTPAPETPAPMPAEAPEPVKLAPEKLGARLVLWLRADKGVVDAMDESPFTKWEDQSGNGHHAVPVAGDVPVGWSQDGLAQKPAVHFGGGTSYLEIADSEKLHFGLEDVTSYVVVSHKSALSGASRIVLTKQAAQYPYRGFGMFTNINNTFGLGALVQYPTPLATMAAADATSYANDKPFLFVAARASDQIVAAAGDGADSVSAMVNNQAVDLTNDARIRIGGQGATGQGLKGAISEIVLVRGAVTKSEDGDLRNYLTQKYALGAP